jgi:acetyl esterase
MTLDRDAAALLAKLQELGARPSAELGVLRARHSIASGTWMQGEREPVASVRDVLVDGAAGRLPARIYHPDPASELPLVAYFHGGGWTAGSVAAADRPCRALANASGCAVVSVEYRLAPETPFPGGLLDCVAAVRWLARHGGELGGDAARLAVAGDSAGGNLAAATALMLREHGGPRLAHQLLIYPCRAPPGADARYPSRRDNATGYQLTAADMEWFWEQYAADPRDQFAAPLLADHLRGLPPATIVTAGFDPLRDEGVAYAERLRADGVATELIEWPGTIHGFFWMAGELGAGRELIARAGAALRAGVS